MSLTRITDTNSFKTAVNEALEIHKDKQELDVLFIRLAEDLLDRNRDRVNENGRWIEHVESYIFRAYSCIKEYEAAQRIIDNMQDTEHATKHKSKQGRIKVLTKEIE